MTITGLLDQYVLPEKGTVEFYVNRSFDINVNAEEARRQVNHWLFTQVSCMMGAGTPTLVIGEPVVWRVPAILTASSIGDVGTAGTVDVDVQTGKMNNTLDHQAELLQGASQLAAKIPAYQPRRTTPPEYIAQNIKSTNTYPHGSPLDIINAANSPTSA